MAKDVKDYIQRCPACQQEKALVQSFPLHMTEIPDRPFDKIVMDLVTDFTKSSKGNKHILTIIDLLTGWPEVILILNKSADTITKAFIRHYLPRHMCPRFILSDNGTELKNQREPILITDRCSHSGQSTANPDLPNHQFTSTSGKLFDEIHHGH